MVLKLGYLRLSQYLRLVHNMKLSCQTLIKTYAANSHHHHHSLHHSCIGKPENLLRMYHAHVFTNSDQ